jgi:ATP-binding cassette, subfamily B, bacterial
VTGNGPRPAMPAAVKPVAPGKWDAWKDAPYSIRYAKPYWKPWFAAIGLMAVSAGLAVLMPWPLAFLIDSVLQHRHPVPHFIVGLVGKSPIGLIAFAAAATLLINALMQGIALLYEYITTKMDQRMLLDLRSDLFEHAQALSFAYHDRTKTGNFIYRVNSMATSAGNIVMALPPVAQAFFTLVGMFWISFRIDPMLALLAMSIIPPIYYALGHYSQKVLPAVREVAGREMEAVSIVHEVLTMLRLVVAFGRERYEQMRYRTQAEAALRARVQVTVRQTLFSFVVETLTAAGTGLVMGFGAYHVLQRRLTVGDLTVILAYIAAIYSPVQQISGTLGSLQNDLFHMHKCKELLEMDPEVKDPPEPVEIDRAAGDIRYEHVHFAYHGRTNTLVDIDFHIEPGQRVAVLGPTGAGKTTLMSLLIRYHDPKQGRILLDGHDLRTLSLKSLRSQAAIVHQEPVLFSGTIADNIRYGRLDASMHEVVEAARAANAHDFIMRLANDYDTQLGERGAQLSGGERQRISIARAFVRDAPILILDEPTSSIDSKTEAVILEALERLMEGRTSLLIAHRLSTTRGARLILVLDEGRLVETGSHADLLARGGLYTQLWNAQVGYQAPAAEPAVEPVVEGARIAELARALDATSDARRLGARKELTEWDRGELIAWAREAFQSGSLEEACVAARLAEATGLSDLSLDVVERGAIMAPERRGPLVSTFRSFDFDAENLEVSLQAIDPTRRGRAIDFLRDALGAELAMELRRLAANGPASLRLVVREALDRADRGGERPGPSVGAIRAVVTPESPHGPVHIRPGRIVLFGMMTKVPVAGVVWQTLHYLHGLRDLGFDVTYVEAHGRTPSMFMKRPEDDGWAQAAAFLGRIADRFGFSGDWAFEAPDSGRRFGLDEAELRRRYASADLLINLHGGMVPRADHTASGRLVYLETDPVEVQMQLAQGRSDTIEYLEAHAIHFSFGENLGNADCGIPVSDQFTFLPTRQPVVLDFWERHRGSGGGVFTTVGNWEQAWREVRFGGEVYHWSKHHEFLKVLDLPRRTDQPLELALSSSSIGADHRELLVRNGWLLRDALEFSLDLDAYRDYIGSSRGEFTVAKDQNVRLRSGWFSDRSATYLAAGKPVITQETGFSNGLPAGEGLFAYSTVEEVVQAIEAINGDHRRHAERAFEIANECFDHRRVLGALLERAGVKVPRGRALAASSHVSDPAAIPLDLVLEPVSRRPVTLDHHTVRAVLDRPVPSIRPDPVAGPPTTSVVVITYENLAFTRLCLESLLHSVRGEEVEVVVVDNGSTDGTAAYLEQLASANRNVRPQLLGENLGFARAVNRGLTAAQGSVLAILNNDTILPPGWLPALCRHLEDSSVGLVGPVTNRCGNEAEVSTTYRSYGELLEFARERSGSVTGTVFDIRTATMFCLAMRRDVFERVGPLDEGFGVGMFEDDDYSLRVRTAGYRVVCAEDGFVHHFGEAAFGKLVRSGDRDRIFRANRARFERKWGLRWTPHGRRPSADYDRLVEQVREVVQDRVPAQATVLVASRGDTALIRFDGRKGGHFPQDGAGVYAGHYPADSAAAIAHLEELRSRGGQFLVFPRTTEWWLSYYEEFQEHLRSRYQLIAADDACLLFDIRDGHRARVAAAAGREG